VRTPAAPTPSVAEEEKTKEQAKEKAKEEGPKVAEKTKGSTGGIFTIITE
jgi:hypothetical protein